MNRVSRFDIAIQELQELQEIVDFREVLRTRQASKLIEELINSMDGLRMHDPHAQEAINGLFTQFFQIVEEVTGKLTEAGRVKIYGMFLNAVDGQDVLDKFQLFCEELIQRQINNFEAARLDVIGGINKSVKELNIPE